MLFNLFTAGLACAIPFASAYTQPVGDSPSGNPISEPGLNDVVPVDEGFTITWEPTTKGTVTLVLLKGPASNAVPQYAIAEKIKNSGSYVWTPKDDLAPGQVGYGIQLIDDATGAYQYTTQFGIANPDYEADDEDDTDATTTSSSSSASSWDAWPTAAPHSTVWGSNSTTAWATGTASSYKPVGTGYTSKVANVTMTAPGVYTPTSMATSAAKTTSAASSTSTRAPAQTGAAANVATSFAGLVFAAGVAVFAL